MQTPARPMAGFLFPPYLANPDFTVFNLSSQAGGKKIAFQPRSRKSTNHFLPSFLMLIIRSTK